MQREAHLGLPPANPRTAAAQYVAEPRPHEWRGGKCECLGSEKSEARYRGARVAFHVAFLFSAFTVPSMVSPFTRPEYSAPATVKLI